MSFIIFQDGVASPTEEGKEIPQVKEVYNADKTLGKKFFHDVLKYIYLVYKREGVYSTFFENERIRLVLDRHFEKRKVEDFEDSKKVRALILEYQNNQFTKMERFYYQLEKDIEMLMERISSIPYTKKVKIQVPLEQNGETTLVETIVEMENFEEKSKAIMSAERLVDYEQKLKDKIFREKKTMKKENTRLFDRKNV